MGVAWPGLAGAGTPPLAAAREYLMGTVAEVRIYATRAGVGVPAALEAALQELRTVDRLMAVQRPDSEASRLNREAAHGPVRVDARVVEVLARSVEVSRLTGGAFDVTVLPAVREWGFIAGRPAVPASATPPIAGYRTLVIDRARGTVAFGSPATAVDLGGIGKGYGLDRARDVLRRGGVTSAWLDLGGNVATIGLPPDAPRWRVGIRHPRREGELLGVVEIGEEAVSTSGDERQWVDDHGRRRGHLFDPRTGAPATIPASTTVVAASAALADALSTGVAVLGPPRGRGVLAQAGAGGIFGVEGANGVVRVRTAGAVRFRAAP